MKICQPDPQIKLISCIKVSDPCYKAEVVSGARSLTVVPKDQISVAVPHLRFSMASGLLNI